MTEYTSSYTGPDDGTSGTTYAAPTDGTSGTTDTAKDEATRLKDSAKQTGGQLLEDAKGEAVAVSQEARRQIGDLWQQARFEVSDQASAQQSRLAGGLTSIGSQLTQMASSTDEQNTATDIVHEVGQRIDSLGRWLDTHGPDELVDEVRNFARRRPGTFLAIAAGAGIVLGRLTRGIKDAANDEPRTEQRTAQYPTRTSLASAGYVDPVEDRPRFADDLSSTAGTSPVPTATVPGTPTVPTSSSVPSSSTWGQR
ncbi:hypothetical protein [Cellulomonas sp. URHD0024]|uniref:hypothetical protein n=1 Tax=Cellulomonas sp. URHD0024 TaxID=1302620 RepID=UPI0004183F18|nr:hypothetical protein [Cellulomonas sp. URHD0024]